MKPQDILFFIILGFLLYKRDSKLFTIVGIISLALSIPLFSLWVFFTAERLVWYAASFLFLAVMINIYRLRKLHE